MLFIIIVCTSPQKRNIDNSTVVLTARVCVCVAIATAPHVNVVLVIKKYHKSYCCFFYDILFLSVIHNNCIVHQEVHKMLLYVGNRYTKFCQAR